MKDAENIFSNLSDHELIYAYSNTGDSWAFEALKAEERRRNNERALIQANKSNKVATASLVVAILSLLVAIAAIFKG